ncbi:hypothetical protein ACFYST_02425 [Kitasatospora sp. NPDC004614]|uniref:hypothetical protein n=1 Tax=unclassified Kitasatospora TaxID=2633591 RepID=UPI003697B6BA
MVDPALKAALVRLRAVKSQRPTGAEPRELADWWEKIADLLDSLAAVFLFEDDRVKAAAEAEAARARADEIRERLNQQARTARRGGG